MDKIAMLEMAIEIAVPILAGNSVISESLPFMKKVKANNTIQLVFNILKMCAGAFKKPDK